MAGISYRFRMTGMALTLNKAFPALFSPTSRTVGEVMVHQVELRSEKLVKDTGKLIIKDLKAATRTWDWIVDFDVRSRISVKSISINISTSDVIFNFIEGGTDVRRAIMPRGYVSKTLPGWLGSRKGGGAPTYVGSDVAMPGIEARNFYKASIKKNRPQFVAGMQKIIIDELRMLGLKK